MLLISHYRIITAPQNSFSEVFSKVQLKTSNPRYKLFISISNVVGHCVESVGHVQLTCILQCQELRWLGTL